MIVPSTIMGGELQEPREGTGHDIELPVIHVPHRMTFLWLDCEYDGRSAPLHIFWPLWHPLHGGSNGLLFT